MARVNGPLMSMSASGALAGSIVFSNWKGRPYVRQLVRPANPKSGGQVSMRAILKFLSQQWVDIPPADQSSWEDLADADVVSYFNAYMKKNLGRNRDFLAPSHNSAIEQVLVIDPITDFTATPAVRSITIEITATNIVGANWGHLLYRGLESEFVPSFTNLIAIVPHTTPDPAVWVDSPLEPDTYYYNAKPFTIDAVIGDLKGEIFAEVL